MRQVIEAKAVCAGCPVRSACLVFALERDLEGVWGGTTEDERRALRAADRRVA
jgi:WhiB family redox-sensing transcriptional regulator